MVSINWEPSDKFYYHISPLHVVRLAGRKLSTFGSFPWHARSLGTIVTLTRKVDSYTCPKYSSMIEAMQKTSVPPALSLLGHLTPENSKSSAHPDHTAWTVFPAPCLNDRVSGFIPIEEVPAVEVYTTDAATHP